MSQRDVIIIGGGISGLSALHFIRTLKPEYNVTLLEAEPRLGGTIGTDSVDGYSFDWGPNGFLDREPLTLRLCEEIGLMPQLEKANPNVSKRFIFRGGRLRKVPMSPPAFLMSNILSLSGKLRVLMEPLAASGNGLDESIYDFGQRRIGKEAADYLIQPMVSGIFGGVAARLSLASCFPAMKEMEQEYGSLFRAMIAKAKKAKREGGKSGSPAGPAGWLTSFHGGLHRLVDELEKSYGQYIVKGVHVAEIAKTDSGLKIVGSDGSTREANDVILAIPSYQAASVVKGLSLALVGSLQRIPYAPIAVVSMGFNANAIHHPLDGFGFLVPAKENRTILGSIWTSSIFDKRAPNGRVQFRTMVGGDGNHESARLDDRALTDIVLKELGPIVGIKEKPEIVRIYRWAKGIPQYRIGHRMILTELEKETEQIGGLHLAGNAYYGIGLNDCIKRSYQIVDHL